MKNKQFILAVLIAAAALAFFGCKGNGSSSKEKNFDKDASYVLGMSFGSELVKNGIVPDFDEFTKGVRDTVSEKKTRFTESEASGIFQTAYFAVMEKMEAEMMQKGVEALQKGIDFLAENAKKGSVVTTSSGLQYEIVSNANGPKPTAADMVRVHYEGKLVDGTVFDSTYKRGEPVEFPLNQVIPGWTEGLQLMSVGSKFILYIPSELGYGAQSGGPIPPNSVLIFEVELLDIL